MIAAVTFAHPDNSGGLILLLLAVVTSMYVEASSVQVPYGWLAIQEAQALGGSLGYKPVELGYTAGMKCMQCLAQGIIV